MFVQQRWDIIPALLHCLSGVNFAFTSPSHDHVLSKILIVEGDPAIIDSVAYILRRDKHEVLRAIGGVAWLTLARESALDLLALGMMLPRRFGLDICRTLRGRAPSSWA